MRIFSLLALLGIAFYGFKYQKKSMEVTMKHFSKSEFGAWWVMMSPTLLKKLDALRSAWGHPIQISPAIGSIGRFYPIGHSNYDSRHNVTKYGEVQAIDIMPTINGRSLNKAEIRKFYILAASIGFTGIGVYPDWMPRAGFHLDVRNDHKAGSPATWSGIKTAKGQKYFGVEVGFA